MSTKGTAAHVVVSLTHQCPHELQTYTGKILAAFVTGLTDRNPAVRKTYASAIGHLMKTAKDSSVEKLFSKLRSWYMDRPDEESIKWAVAYTFQAVTRHNPDKMKAHAAQAMPIAFLAMHEPKTESNEDILEVKNIKTIVFKTWFFITTFSIWSCTLIRFGTKFGLMGRLEQVSLNIFA